MNNEIIYIGFYDVPTSKFKRVSALSAINKMDYISDAINRAGFDIHLISPSWYDDSAASASLCKTTTVLLNQNKKLTKVFSYGTANKLARNFKILNSLFWLFFWMVKNLKKNEKVLVYHSPWIALPVLLAKKIKRFKLILEVEEVYSDVSSIHPYFDKLEQKIFAKADYFLYSTEMLANKINSNKEGIIIYGNYSTPHSLVVPKDDGKYHLIYAGIIDSHKAGAFNAIESALYLDKNYVMHIIGFGEVDKLKNRIEEINKISKCKVYYEGIKNGNEYVEFCQSCHIGLSTQKMEGAYLNTSFPSKILSYLGMGLQVVSCYVLCVVESKIGKQVIYYKEDNPISIANAIKNVKIDNKMNSKKLVKRLDIEFVESVKKMLSNV